MINDKQMDYVDWLMKREYQQVGFLPRQALTEYNERDQIILATENGDPSGYALFYDGRNGKRPRKDPATLRVHMIAIQDDARRVFHGTGLVSRLLYHAALNQFNTLALWCATDLDANKFWRALGFTNDRIRLGGEKDNRMHNHWFLELPAVRPLPHPNTASAGN